MLKSIIQISGLYFASAVVTAGLVLGWNKRRKSRLTDDQDKRESM